MSGPTYRIRDWSEHFEVAQSRRPHVKHSWVATPNKHDGKGYRRLMARGGAAYFGAWNLLIQVASKCPTRGTLAHEDGALSPSDLEAITGCAAALFAEAIPFFCEIGWLEEIGARRRIIADKQPSLPAMDAATPATNPARPVRPEPKQNEVWRIWIDVHDELKMPRPLAAPADTGCSRSIAKIGLSVEQLKSSMRKYLLDPDPFVAKQGRPLRLFAQRINAYREGVPCATHRPGRVEAAPGQYDGISAGPGAPPA